MTLASLWGVREAAMKKEYLDPNFIGPIVPPKNLTDEQKAAVVKVILRYSGTTLTYFRDTSENTSAVNAV
jgi:hypothetical protein